MLSFRKATIEDVQLYFDWVNEEEVRKQSYNSEQISFENHFNWFEKKIKDETCLMLLFKDETEYVGQVRLEKTNDLQVVISISVANKHRGKGYAPQILKLSSNVFLLQNPSFTIYAYIKTVNLTSKISFEKAGFVFDKTVFFRGFESNLYLKKTI